MYLYIYTHIYSYSHVPDISFAWARARPMQRICPVHEYMNICACKYIYKYTTLCYRMLSCIVIHYHILFYMIWGKGLGPPHDSIVVFVKTGCQPGPRFHCCCVSMGGCNQAHVAVFVVIDLGVVTS